jgi:hypothetical protein
MEKWHALLEQDVQVIFASKNQIFNVAEKISIIYLTCRTYSNTMLNHKLLLKKLFDKNDKFNRLINNLTFIYISKEVYNDGLSQSARDHTTL